MDESGEGGFTPEEAVQEESKQESEEKYETKTVEDIIGEPNNRTVEQIPPGEFWVIDTISHADIEVPGNSGIRAEVVGDTIFRTEAGAMVDIPEGAEEIEIIERKLAA